MKGEQAKRDYDDDIGSTEIVKELKEEIMGEGHVVSAEYKQDSFYRNIKSNAEHGQAEEYGITYVEHTQHWHKPLD